MKCPHCLTAFHVDWKETELGADKTSHWTVRHCVCPTCKRYVIILHEKYDQAPPWPYRKERNHLCYPKAVARAPIGPEVPSTYADEYAEACLTLADSPKASAALSRRCLQHILRDKADIERGDLSREIQQVIDSGKVPQYIAESLDAVRNIGNFAAHPMKSTATGEVIDVELGEAEWNLDVLEALFDFYFVQPESVRKKREALNAKLADAGKPEMK